MPRRWRGALASGALAFGLAAAMVAAAVGLALGLTGRLSEVVVILAVTTLGIAASFLPAVRRLRGAPEIGNYLLLMFCVAIGSMARFQHLAAAGPLLAYCAVVVVSAVVIHFALAAIFRIDADTAIITSTAAVFSPPFVGPVAAALKNPEIVVSGLTTGVVGYAVGNYLGLLVAYALRP